ncbi:MAG: nicotinate-nucleotide adenylyltransferase [Bacteroidales bacterium]|nr:nicotinate-nucleotide adenylyltransferase [Bacteroidales bacterium]MBN2758730.1 nicotinate-nucleotide adenylyltransferase [Bacteroidales bacterium]
MKAKIGLYFGSFNPIHNGHLAIANYMLEFTDIEQIWFVVSPQNPFKQKQNILPDYQRLEMVNLAIEDKNGYYASNIEFNLPKPSFTIDTLTYLYDKYPDKEFVLIMGTDNLINFHKWKNFNEILRYYHIYVYPRPGSVNTELMKHPQVKLVDAPLMEISSSFLRNSIKEKKNVQFFMPQKVYDFIKEMHFYE